eukprot:Amastigsp_a508867_92.p2 type:complete len:294 gc:universal Amastigsp_a508867_92:966-85(-)
MSSTRTKMSLAAPKISSQIATALASESCTAAKTSRMAPKTERTRCTPSTTDWTTPSSVSSSVAACVSSKITICSSSSRVSPDAASMAAIPDPVASLASEGVPSAAEPGAASAASSPASSTSSLSSQSPRAHSSPSSPSRSASTRSCSANAAAVTSWVLTSSSPSSLHAAEHAPVSCAGSSAGAPRSLSSNDAAALRVAQIRSRPRTRTARQWCTRRQAKSEARIVSATSTCLLSSRAAGTSRPLENPREALTKARSNDAAIARRFCSFVGPLPAAARCCAFGLRSSRTSTKQS